MSRYVVEVNGADVSGYLKHGLIRQGIETAQGYPHPSNARQAGRAFEKSMGNEEFVWFVVERSTGRRL